MIVDFLAMLVYEANINILSKAQDRITFTQLHQGFSER